MDSCQTQHKKMKKGKNSNLTVISLNFKILKPVYETGEKNNIVPIINYLEGVTYALVCYFIVLMNLKVLLLPF